MSVVVDFPIPEHVRFRKEAALQEYENAKMACDEAARGDFRCPHCVEQWKAANERRWTAWRRYMDAI